MAFERIKIEKCFQHATLYHCMLNKLGLDWKKLRQTGVMIKMSHSPLKWPEVYLTQVTTRGPLCLQWACSWRPCLSPAITPWQNHDLHLPSPQLFRDLLNSNSWPLRPVTTITKNIDLYSATHLFTHCFTNGHTYILNNISIAWMLKFNSW